MMAEFSWIQMFPSVTLMLQLVAAAECYDFILRDGGEVTLSCENGKTNPDNCDRTTWIFSRSNTHTVTLFEYGAIHNDAQTESDRLSVTANCSLVIKKLSAQDVGQYTCRSYDALDRQGLEFAADLCVVNMTDHKDDSTLRLTCSVSTNKQCQHYTVRWLDEQNEDLTVSRSPCSASVTFTAADRMYASGKDEFLKCRVTFGENVQEFTFRIPSAQKMGWWTLAVAALGAAALITGVIIAIRWRRAAGNKFQKNENAGLKVKSAVTPSAAGTLQTSTGPEDAVLYASINHSKKSKAQVRDKDDDEAVTYSILKRLSSSSFGPYLDF